MKAELDLALRQRRSEDELRAALHSAADETDRLARLAADLLLLARLHRAQLPIRLQRVDVGRLVVSAVDGFAGRASAGGVRLDASVEPDLVAQVDEQRLRQALDNLIDNAMRYAGAGGTVHVNAATDRGSLVMSVADSGPGFAEEFLAQAFEPFSRTDAGRAREEGGAGLGLAIVRAVVEAHRGTVAASNRPAGGAIVEMRIPL
jgi:signal transduction histidine kinase